MSAEPTRNLGIRFDAEFSAWLKRFESSTGIEAVILGRALFKAARTFYDKHHYLVFPLEIVVSGSARDGDKQKLTAGSMLTEEPRTYHAVQTPTQAALQKQQEKVLNPRRTRGKKEKSTR